MAGAGACPCVTQLPDDCLSLILASLPAADVASAARACGRLASVAGADAAVWRLKSIADFGGVTDPDAWRRRGGGADASPGARGSVPAARYVPAARPPRSPAAVEDDDDGDRCRDYRWEGGDGLAASS